MADPLHPGERLATYFENFFKTIIAIATLGANITFTKIVQNPVPPFQYFGFTQFSVQWFLAIAWLNFLLALAFTSFFATLLTLYRPQAVKAFGTKSNHRRKMVMWYATMTSGMLYLFTILAALFLSLVVTAYSGPIGWIAVGFVTMFGILGFSIILYYSPLFSRFPEPGPRHSSSKRYNTGDPLTAHMRLHGQIDDRSALGNWDTTPSKTRNGSCGSKDGNFVRGQYVDGHNNANSRVGSGLYNDNRYSRASTSVPEALNDIQYEEKSGTGQDNHEEDRWGPSGAVFQRAYHT